MLINEKVISEIMSFAAIFQLVETVGALITLKQQIEIEVLKNRIKDVVDVHKEEFKYISEIDKLFKALGTNAVLTEALSQTNEVCQLNWRVVADNLNQKVKIMNDLTSQYSDVNLTKYDFTLKDGFNLGMSILGSGTTLNNFTKSFKSGSKQSATNKLQSGMQKQKVIKADIDFDGVRPSKLKPGEIEVDNFAKPKGTKGSVNGGKTIEVSGNIESSITAPKKSILHKMTRFGSKIGKAVLGVIRVIGLLATVYSIYQNEVEITTLVRDYKEAVNEYGEDGQFKKNEVDILNMMTLIAQLLSNLAYASYAAINEISNSYLICGLTFSSFNDYFLKQADLNNPKALGVDIIFCEASL